MYRGFFKLPFILALLSSLALSSLSLSLLLSQLPAIKRCLQFPLSANCLFSANDGQCRDWFES